jgi:hypothetical protein
MRKFIFLFLFSFLFLIPLANAGSFGYNYLNNLGTFKQNEAVEFRQVCSDATYITITSISYPNSTIAVSNISMTNTGYGEFNYTFDLTSQLGRYDVRGISDGCEGTFATYFEITPSGINLKPENANLMLALLIVTMLLTFFFATLAYKFLEKDNLMPIGIFFLLLSFIFVAYVLYLGVSFSSDYLTPSISGPQVKIFNSVLYSLVGIAFLGMLFFTVKVLKEIKERKSLQNNSDGYTQQ